MKVIKYQFCTLINHGTVESPEWIEVFEDKEIRCPADKLSACEAIAKREAYNGEYTVEDEDIVRTPTQLDIIEAQVTYTAMMTDTLLEV